MLYLLPSAWRMKGKQRQNHVSLLKHDLSHRERKQTKINEWATNSLKNWSPKWSNSKCPANGEPQWGFLRGEDSLLFRERVGGRQGGEDCLLNHKSGSWVYVLPLGTTWLYQSERWIFFDTSESHRRSYGIHLGRYRISVLLKNQDVPCV